MAKKQDEAKPRNKGGVKAGPRAGSWIQQHCTTSDLSKLWGVSARTVRDLDLRGVIKQDAAGILTVESTQAYLDHLRKVAAGRSDGENSLATERARETKLKSEMAELKLKQLRGEVLSLDEVSASWSAFAAQVKAAFLSVPGKARAKIPHLTAHDAESLKVLCRDILTDMAEEVKAAVIGASDGDLRGK